MTRLLYLAGPSAELERVEATAALAVSMGWTIAEPWWLRVREAASRGWATDADVPADFMRESAVRNETAIGEVAKSGGRFVGLCRGTGGLSSGHSYELALIKAAWSVRSVMEEAIAHIGGPPGASLPGIYLVGDPRAHVGIWTGPAPFVVATVEEALR